MNVILDPQGQQIPGSARRVLDHAWKAAGFRSMWQRQQAMAQGYRFARLAAAEEQEFVVELVRTIRTTVRVKASSAGEIKRRLADVESCYAEDIWQDGTDDCDSIRAVSIQPVR
jgi:hypothetical protein